jgi:hypothetical protein
MFGSPSGGGGFGPPTKPADQNKSSSGSGSDGANTAESAAAAQFTFAKPSKLKQLQVGMRLWFRVAEQWRSLIYRRAHPDPAPANPAEAYKTTSTIQSFV